VLDAAAPRQTVNPYPRFVGIPRVYLASSTRAAETDKGHPYSYFPSSPAVSPVPLVSSETLQKYGGDAKLFPFPAIFLGVKKPPEEERRSGPSLNASSPDIAYHPTSDEFWP
jgi:hypothetical protein